MTTTMATTLSNISSSSFLVGLGLGVATTALYSRVFCKQIKDTAEIDDEDNDSAGEDIVMFNNIFPAASIPLYQCGDFWSRHFVVG